MLLDHVGQPIPGPEEVCEGRDLKPCVLKINNKQNLTHRKDKATYIINENVITSKNNNNNKHAFRMGHVWHGKETQGSSHVVWACHIEHETFCNSLERGISALGWKLRGEILLQHKETFYIKI